MTGLPGFLLLSPVDRESGDYEQTEVPPEKDSEAALAAEEPL